MSLLEIVLLTFAIINLIFSGLVYLHSTRTVIVSFYILISFFASLWSLATLSLGLSNLAPEYYRLAAICHYIFGNLAYLSFFWFAVFYPRKNLKSLAIPWVLTAINLSVLLIIPFSGYFLVNSFTSSFVLEDIAFFVPAYSVFIFSLSGVFIAGLIILLGKLKSVTGEEKKQIFYAALANFIAGNLGIYLNLILPLYGNFSFFLINPILVTLALTGVGLYNLLVHRLFNVKLILAELFTVAIWIVLLARVFFAVNELDRLVNLILFGFTVLFGIFLIRSVLKEVKLREELEHITTELEKTNARLTELDQLKSEFLSLASHQLRSPLAAIKGYASLILENSFGEPPVAIREAVDKIFQSSKSLVSIVQDFLDVSRIEQGRMKYDFAETDIKQLIKAVSDELMPIIKQRGLEIKFTDDGHSSYTIKADFGKVKQVVGNLIDNAIKYTPKGVIEVRLSKNKEKGELQIAIKDSGVGIPKETLPKLFQKFSRDKKANEVNVMGTGLGLYVARELIHGHHGEVWAESEGAGKGSTFNIMLPLDQHFEHVEAVTELAKAM